jgi:hypothetical protein
MSSKPRQLKAKVLNPARTRREEFKCSSCRYASYNARDYKILFEAKKVVFFQFPPTSKKVFCDDCLIDSVAQKAKPDEDELSLLVLDGEESYIVKVKIVDKYE